jgi:hypothetical protein
MNGNINMNFPSMPLNATQRQSPHVEPDKTCLIVRRFPAPPRRG